jgi:Type II intron maturase
MLYWYRFCENLVDLKYVIEILRESCFLTLCRKHNKSKSWVYSTYTSDLIILQSLFDTKSFFPTRRFLFKLNDKRYFFSNFRVDEKFFLGI